ncbi:MAG: hypothetical protein GY787_15955 [Alteromonadales bacterium]|nr:hypothetical protein [Alteromonadales bacterium]
MPELSANITSRLARDVYAISKRPTLSRAISDLKLLHGNSFEFADTHTLHAKTGSAGIKISSAFGFVLLGKGTL